MSRRQRLTVVMTHPVQYYSPWFRYIHQEADGVDLHVLYVSTPTPQQQGAGFEETFEWDVALREGYESEVFRFSEPSDRFESGSFWALDAPGIGRAIERQEPDAVLVMGWHCLALVRVILACRRRRIPLLYRGDTMGAGPRSGLGLELWRLRTRWLLSRFDRHLAVGKRAREHLERFGVPQEAIFGSPHAVDNAFFARAAAPFQASQARAAERARLGIAPEAFVSLFVGKLEPNKRVDDAIRAVSALGEASSLLVVGAGPLREAYETLSSQVGAAVRFRGFVNQTELGKAYALADCLVLPSRSETWGLVVNEAMATGLPCVVSDGVGCGPDLIEEGKTGETFPVGDIDALTRALRRLASEKDSGRSRGDACVNKMSEYDFCAATEGLMAACRSLGG